MNKFLLIGTSIIATLATLYGAAECYENTAPLFIMCVFGGGFLFATLFAHALEG